MEDTLLRSLLDVSIKKKYAKNEFLVTEGKIDRNIYFIEKGAVRVFLQTEHEELTIRFGYNQSFITALSSFIAGTPSEFYIQAIRASEIRVIAREDFMRLTQSEVHYLQLYNAILEGLVLQQLEREIDLLTPSPAERLRRVRQRSPQVFEEIPSRYIASYLRMTPETLSRIRKLNS